MTRQQLEHVLRAAAGISGGDRFVVIGSQAILGQFPSPPEALLVSNEADLFSLDHLDYANLIDGSIGEGSPFHQTFGYFAHGVGETTAVLPEGWKDRLVPFATPRTGGATGLCIEVHDLAVSKLVAGREKDLKYVRTLVKHRLVDAARVQELLSVTPITDAIRALCVARLQRANS